MDKAVIVRFLRRDSSFYFLYKNGNFVSKTVILCHLVSAK